MAFLLRPTISLSSKFSPATPKFAAKMPTNSSNSVSVVPERQRKLPILLFDIMSTIVRDPFYEDIPAFFGMSWKELMECKHPTAWVEFEKGLIDEIELAKKFFKDGRPFDLEGLKNCMSNRYAYLEGMEALLHDLKQNDYEIHAFTNYPVWYQLIEDKLKLSNYLSWTFASCKSGLRKPDPDFYLEVLSHLKVEPSSCIFVDDSLENIVGAKNAGMVGLLFTNAALLRQDLSSLGIDFSRDDHSNPAKLAEGQ
ncbi:Haloacid dehalogenase-like hydrolase [Dillenia turbinata]|uniref:Haloacid dehalogenase-like hydrolase n=1 Tax=Dillenia turbinata TaxID=194707 RepID=A0AAN8YWA8_9MAGN